MPAVSLLKIAALLSLALLVSCTTPQGPRPDRPSAAATRLEIERRIPARVPDRAGWASDIQTAFDAQRIDPMVENICAVLAIVEQETGYQVDPRVPNLARVAREEIDRRAARLHIPKLVVDVALKLRSPDGRTYAERLQRAETERELSSIYDDLIAKVPLGRRLFADFNPVETGGPMQVSIGFAETVAQGYPFAMPSGVRSEVFTRRGGLYFGIAHLLGYTTPYTQKVHRFADYNAGWYASRNAAFQQAVAVASGAKLVLDGDLLIPGAGLDKPGQTERAVRSLGSQLGMNDRDIRKALATGDRLDFGDSELYRRVYDLADSRKGQTLPRAVLPGIELDSPKITRRLTTGWFADRVNTRYQQCIRR